MADHAGADPDEDGLSGHAGDCDICADDGHRLHCGWQAVDGNGWDVHAVHRPDRLVGSGADHGLYGDLCGDRFGDHRVWHWGLIGAQ